VLLPIRAVQYRLNLDGAATASSTPPCVTADASCWEAGAAAGEIPVGNMHCRRALLRARAML
jgi:hypothetical protein